MNSCSSGVLCFYVGLSQRGSSFGNVPFLLGEVLVVDAFLKDVTDVNPAVFGEPFCDLGDESGLQSI